MEHQPVTECKLVYVEFSSNVDWARFVLLLCCVVVSWACWYWRLGLCRKSHTLIVCLYGNLYGNCNSKTNWSYSPETLSHYSMYEGHEATLMLDAVSLKGIRANKGSKTTWLLRDIGANHCAALLLQVYYGSPSPLLLSSPLLTQTNTAQLWRHINTSNTSSLTRSRGITSTYTIIRHLTEHCLLILHDHNHNRISILLLMRFWTERNNVTLSFDWKPLKKWVGKNYSN